VKPTDVYVDLVGNKYFLAGLDAEERRLLAGLRRRAQKSPDWDAFDNYWTQAVTRFYDARSLSRAESSQTAVFQIAQDLSGRLAVAAGLARVGDYRDDLQGLIREHFPTRRAFCKATGLSEDMLSHVLAGRKDLSLTALTKALERIGYTLCIRPTGQPISARGRRTG
jgi:hypothetical protein